MMNSGRQSSIAFFLPTLTAGGAERVIMNLAQGMSERGIRVDLVVATATGAFLEQIPSTVRLIDLKASRVISSLVPLIAYLRRERPRALIASMSHANVVALWAGRLARSGTPIIATVHTTMSQYGPQQSFVARRLWPRLLRAFYPWAARVVAVSRGAADDLARTTGLARDQIEVVYNPVITPAVLAGARQPLDHPWFAPGQPPVILGAGRLTAAKDFPTLVRAFAEVRRCRSARLLILGEGEERPRLESLARELELNGDFALPGYSENATAYMARCAVFVLSSAWEGLPTVLVEALAAGARVVSTDCRSGPREILGDGHLGALVPVGDVSSLSAAILAALSQGPSATSMESLRLFTRDAAVDHYLQIVEQAQ